MMHHYHQLFICIFIFVYYLFGNAFNFCNILATFVCLFFSEELVINLKVGNFSILRLSLIFTSRPQNAQILNLYCCTIRFQPDFIWKMVGICRHNNDDDDDDNYDDDDGDGDDVNLWLH